MENHITQILLAVLITIITGKPLLTRFRAKERELGGAVLLSHIIGTVKSKGFIIIKSNDEEMVLVPKVDNPKKDA